MINNLVETGYDLISFAKRYADTLCTQTMQHSLRQPDLQWKNPENIESGSSGNILFLLELYGQTGEEKYLSAVDQTIREAVSYCEKNSTNNYSLYTGRSGLIYVLMQRYLLNGEQYFLQELLQMVRPVNKEYLHSRYTSDYLYDGRAGTLLLLEHLYLLTKEEFLLSYIGEFVQKIIANACFSEHGMYWSTGDEMNLGASCGFARGTAGIRYVFSRLNTLCPDASFRFVLNETDRYIRHCWVEEYSNWGDFRKDILNHETLDAYRKAYALGDADLFMPADDLGWANGAAGILLALQENVSSRKRQLVNEKIATALKDEQLCSYNLYNGLAGLGMLSLHDENANGILENVTRQLRDRLTAVPDEDGFMHGTSGSLYFLLKTNKATNKAENILVPFSGDPVIAKDAPLASPLDTAALRKTILSKYFPRTVFVLDKAASAVFAAYLQQPSSADANAEMENFIHFVRGELTNMISPGLHERLTDVLSLEIDKLNYARSDKRTLLQSYLDKLLFNDKVLEQLNKPDAWLLQQQLQVSSEMKIVHTKWDWSFKDDFEPMNNKTVLEKFLKNLSAAPKEFEFIFQLSGRQEIIEVHCDLAFQLALHRFNEPKPIIRAITEIKYYVHSLTEKALESLLNALGASKSSTTKEFVSSLDTMILDKIKPLIHRNILEFK